MNSIDIYNQMERLHGAIDDLYDTINPPTKIASDNYLRADDEYQTLHKMLEEQFKEMSSLVIGEVDQQTKRKIENCMKEKRSLVSEAFFEAIEAHEKGIL